MLLAERVAACASAYRGPLALKSFDPAIIAYLARPRQSARTAGAPCPLGIVAEASYAAEDWSVLSADQKSNFANFLHYPETRPDFLSFCVDDLPHPTPFLLRALKATPVMVWTVRTPAQKAIAARMGRPDCFRGDWRSDCGVAARCGGRAKILL